MNVLMLSTDSGILAKGSEVERRMLDYGNLVEELHIIVFTKHDANNEDRMRIADNVFVYPTNTRFSFLYFFNACKIGKKIIENCKLKIENSVITVQDPFENGLVAYLIKKKTGLALELQIHTDFLSPYFWQESLKNKIRVILGKWLIKKADGLRVVSERVKKSIIVNCKLKIENSAIAVLPIFVDTEKIKNTPIRTDLHKKYPNYNFIILMASRLSVEKNIGLAIEAIKCLIPNYPNVLLLIVGDGPERETLKLQVASHKLQDNVVFEPWTDDLVSYYKTADLFLLTSNYEGYGRTVVEATAAGLPALMSDVGVAIGSVVPVGDTKALADNLKLFVENKSTTRYEVLENQKKILYFYKSKQDYLNQIKQSWSSCFSLLKK